MIGPPCTTQADCTGATVCAQPVHACGARSYCVPGMLSGPCNVVVGYCRCDGSEAGIVCPELPEGYVPPGGAYWGSCIDAGSAEAGSGDGGPDAGL
jgi:hypothetical protein